MPTERSSYQTRSFSALPLLAGGLLMLTITGGCCVQIKIQTQIPAGRTSVLSPEAPADNHEIVTYRKHVAGHADRTGEWSPYFRPPGRSVGPDAQGSDGSRLRATITTSERSNKKYQQKGAIPSQNCINGPTTFSQWEQEHLSKKKRAAVSPLQPLDSRQAQKKKPWCWRDVP